MKNCTKCGEIKAVSEFSKDASKRDGLQSKCKACEAAYRATIADKTNCYNAAYRASNSEGSCYERPRLPNLPAPDDPAHPKGRVPLVLAAMLQGTCSRLHQVPACRA